MAVAKVFKSGNSQAVRLPKEFQFHSKEVEIFKQGNKLILQEKPTNLAEAFEVLIKLPKDFFHGKRKDLPPQKRENFE